MNSSVDLVEAELAAIREQLAELRNSRRKLDRLEAEIAMLRNNSKTNDSNELSSVTDRRGMLKKVAGLAAGIAMAGVLQPAQSRGAQRNKLNSPDATGASMLVGDPNTATMPGDVTSLNNATSDLFPLLWQTENYGTTPFTPPASSAIASAAYIDDTGSPTINRNLYALYAEANSTSTNNFAIGLGVQATNIGIQVSTNAQAGTGIEVTANNAGGIALLAQAFDNFSIAGQLVGGRAVLNLLSAPSAVSNPNATTPSGGGTGDVYRGSTDGGLWYNTGGTHPYCRIADSTTAGALTLTAPQRLVDTRTNSGFFDAGNHFGSDTLRTYNIMSLANPDLPVGTRGVIGRITVVNATGAGGIQESPNPPPNPPSNDLGFGSAVSNFPPAATFPAFGVPFTSALDSSGNIRVHSTMAAGGQVDVIIDIVGYYL